MSDFLIDYPIRPSKHPSESLSGYMHRFFWANGVPVPKKISDALSFLHSRHPSRGRHFRDLENLTGGVLKLNRLVTLDYFLQPYRCLDRPYFFQVFIHTPQFCPTCLKQHGYWQMIWELALFTACPIHLCELIHRCPRCGQHFDWFNLSGWACGCGMPVTDMPTKRASRRRRELTWFLCNIAAIPKPATYKRPGYEGGFGYLSFLEAYVTIQLIQDIHRYAHRQTYHHPTAHINWLDWQHFRHQSTSIIPPVLSNWPYDFLDWICNLIDSKPALETPLPMYILEKTYRFSLYLVHDLPIVKAINFVLKTRYLHRLRMPSPKLQIIAGAA